MRVLGATIAHSSCATTRRPARATTLVLVLVLIPVLVGECGRDECEPGDCEPCIGDHCEVTCVDPDDEDIGYLCDWECLKGATCDLECEEFCCLVCNASDCTGAVNIAVCSNGAHCTMRDGGDTVCDASRCDHDCPGNTCVQICRNGSDCDLHCGPDDETSPEVCSAACDGTSSCHLKCDGPCVLCCGGSADCSMDCPDGGQSCEGDAIVCGTSCPVDPSSLERGEDRSKYNFCPTQQPSLDCSDSLR